MELTLTRRKHFVRANQRPLGQKYKVGLGSRFSVSGCLLSEIYCLHLGCCGHGFQMPQGQLLLGISEEPGESWRGVHSHVQHVLQ